MEKAEKTPMYELRHADKTDVPVIGKDGNPPPGWRIARRNGRGGTASASAPEATGINKAATPAEEAPTTAPERKSYVSAREPTPKDRVMTDILTDPDLRKRHQEHLDNGKPGDFLKIILRERGLLEGEDLEDATGTSDEPIPVAPIVQEDISIVQEVNDVPLSAGVETHISEHIPDPAPSAAGVDPAVHRFIASSTQTVDPGVLFTQLRESNGATTPPRQSIREKLARAHSHYYDRQRFRNDPR